MKNTTDNADNTAVVVTVLGDSDLANVFGGSAHGEHTGAANHHIANPSQPNRQRQTHAVWGNAANYTPPVQLPHSDSVPYVQGFADADISFGSYGA